MSNSSDFTKGYSDVNGIKMYYEIYGDGNPIVLIHGGGSTIQTSFGKLIPLLAKHRKVIAVELQAHGRTNDRNTGLSFTQDAADVVKLLENIRIEKADVLGFSNGGQTAIEIGIHYPQIVRKLIICSAFYKRSGTFTQFWDGFANAQFSDMPEVYNAAFLKVNNNKDAVLNMFKRDVERMKNFKGWTDEEIQSIKAPTLIVSGDLDVATPEHTVEMYHNIPKCQLAIIPGGHGKYIGELNTLTNNFKDEYLIVPMLEEFLDEE